MQTLTGTLTIEGGECRLDGETLLALYGVENLGAVAAFLSQRGLTSGDRIRVTGITGKLGALTVFYLTSAELSVAPEQLFFLEGDFSLDGEYNKGAAKKKAKKQAKKKAKKKAEALPPLRDSDEYFVEAAFDREQQQPQKQQQQPQQQQQPTQTLECTPQLEIRKVLIPAKVYGIGVWVDQEPATPGAEVRKVRVEVAQNVEYVSVDVWLDCSSHFALGDMSNPPRITINTETGISNEMSFTLEVLELLDDKPMFVSAFFRYNQRPCGKITRYLQLVNGRLQWKQFVPPVTSKGEVVLPSAAGPPSVSIEADAVPAEICVEVLKTEANDSKSYTLKCYTPQGKWEGPWNLPQVSKDLVNTYMQKFMANEGEARIASLQGAGMDFWDVLRDEVKPLIWTALESGARTMSLISEEPYIPWELMVPYQKVQNPRKPLGVEIQFGRWVVGDYKSPRQRIPMKNGYIVCPKTSGLTSAAQEVNFLAQLKPDFAPADQILPATFVGVNKGLAGPPRNVIHFICHGKSAALQTLELDKPETLDCSQVRTLKGFQAAFKEGPVAFLNACEVGGQVLTLDGVGGFANSFIELGASAVIAPLWPVQDKVALDVTQTFYPQALKGVPFAEVMKQIRAKAYAQAVDSYAAYCFYGDPMASATSI